MMGTEDWEERRATNYTPTIALGIAGFLLLVVGAFTYREHVKNTLEKEYAEKERDLMLRHGYVPYPAGQSFGYNGAPGAQPPGQTPNPQNTQAQIGFQGANTPSAASNPQTPTNPNNLAAAAAIETSLPEPRDPELDSIRESLDQVREQSRRTEQQYREITGDVNRSSQDSTASAPILSEEGIGDISADLPEFLREATNDPPGGNPSVQERLARVRQQVLREPSIAQITNYNNDWGIVTFNAGAAQNVQKDQRFAIRRGGDILGWIKVDEVQANQSIGIMVTKNAENDLAIKPDVGDDLINFELF
ncbi:MAG: hypothetical protein P1U85_06685 [Verrucomicrobiales bacterium]|nr:hypothetical protein [Verrucomicrobiales bacterium]